MFGKNTALWCAVVVSLVLATGAFAQSSAGSGAVTGTVQDESGAVVPDAQVVLVNGALGVRRPMQTSSAGVFSAPALTPATEYVLTVSKEGFTSWSSVPFQVLVGQTVKFPVVLRVGTTTSQVQVTAEAPLVDETKTGVSTVVEQAQIMNLPINGRRADTFVLLAPAVTDDGTFGLVSARGIAAGNNFMTDGADTTNAFYNENAGRTRISTQISQDAVQEFQVQTNNYSAEFGRAIGVVINTVTRSGTNQLHGTLYEFFRNRTLNATDRYANGINPPEWRHQVGGSIGGPIVRDKLFYFANGEIVKRNFPGLNRINSNSFTDPTGNFIPASGCTATDAQCAAAIKFIQSQMNVLVPRTVSSAMGFAKVDWRPNEANSVSVSANAMHWKSPHGIQTQAVLSSGNMLSNNGDSTVETRYFKTAWTRTIGTNKVNEFRFNVFKDRLADPESADLMKKETGMLNLSVAGIQLGMAQGYPRVLPSELRFQFVNNLSLVSGAHSWKFGVDTATNEDYINQLYNRFGSYSYSTLTAFARDFTGNTTGAKNYSSFQQAFGNPVQDFRTSDVAGYLQDVWKVTRKFTLNYGVRYEHTWLPQPWQVNKDYPQTGRIPSPTNNFSPRLSLSYAPNAKTVFRAGYGIFWARFHTNGIDTLLLGNGQFQPAIYVNATTSGAPVFPAVFSGPSGMPAGTVNLAYASPNFHNPYVQQGNVAIERELTRDLGLTVSYIWSRGIGIWTQRDMNLMPPTTTGTYVIQDSTGKNVGAWTTPLYTTKMDNRYGKILMAENGGRTMYDGLAVQLRKRMSRSFMAQVSYTWSHAIDNANQQGASWNVGWNYNNVTYPGDYNFDKGSSSLDQRHRAVINWLWTPTFTRNTSAFAKYFVNGWQLSTITTLASSHPWTATVSTSGSQFPGVNLAYVSLNGSGGWNRVPFWPVGTLDVDRYYRVDSRLTRELPFGERFKGYLIFEAFNTFNTITNTGVQTQAFTASGGVLKPTPHVGDGNQSQGFPDGTNARRMQVALRFVF